ncbi:hypothetical protein DEO72_LG4g17 [Vigna unguiculata]|uniref:Uncharacterized protein n=1 Tax=Vigna unguiculata TaxID=3917 RepID=A0A4D6LK36_VIGUN|nr:hypothetical protein DEO72_LG4g17 [Vigna unguiculata]
MHCVLCNRTSDNHGNTSHHRDLPSAPATKPAHPHTTPPWERESSSPDVQFRTIQIHAKQQKPLQQRVIITTATLRWWWWQRSSRRVFELTRIGRCWSATEAERDGGGRAKKFAQREESLGDDE